MTPGLFDHFLRLLGLLICHLCSILLLYIRVGAIQGLRLIMQVLLLPVTGGVTE